MVKRVALILAAVVFFVAAPARAATVYIQNTSTVVTDTQLRNALPALQAQVSDDFAPIWDIDAKLVVSNTPPAGAWTLEVSDNSTVYGALGYHDVCNQDGHGHPCGFVFAATTLQYGGDPTSTLSHELLEMLADPYLSTTVKVGSRFYIQEVCDAPEADAYVYTRAGADGTPVTLSDFVTPFWFRVGHVGPYDFRGHIARPLQLLPGGYISWWANGRWHQDFRGHGFPTADAGRA